MGNSVVTVEYHAAVKVKELEYLHQGYNSVVSKNRKWQQEPVV